jgi:hypothetical protein
MVVVKHSIFHLSSRTGLGSSKLIIGISEPYFKINFACHSSVLLKFMLEEILQEENEVSPQGGRVYKDVRP